jgi:hypothetical protein
VTGAARKTAVVGWWGTWPAAEPGAAGGYVVSDGALAALESGRVEEGVVSPAGLGARAARWLAAASASLPGPVPGAAGEAERIAREALQADLFHAEALGELLADPELGAAFVYLPGLDILREGWRRGGADLFRVLDRAREHARVVDGALAEALSGLEPSRDALVLLGLPGRAGAGPGVMAWRGPRLGDLAGPALPLTGAASTLLAGAGYPVDARMCPDEELLGPGTRVLRTAARPAAPAAEAAGLEAEVLERLRSLGYVE